MERLRATPGHMLLVRDEGGHFHGIITPLDVLDAMAGGFDRTGAVEPEVVEREDGSLLVAGSVPADEFADRVGIAIGKDRAYETIAGLVLDRAAEPPRIGQPIVIDGWRIKVVDLDGRRIDKLRVQRAPGAS